MFVHIALTSLVHHRPYAPLPISPAALASIVPNYAMVRLRDVFRRILRPANPDPALNSRLRGYPRNHDYAVSGPDLVPSRRLRQRWSRIAELYPRTLTSLLDVGSCKGYFVLDAARRPTCHAAVGIDVYEPFVTLARDVAHRSGQSDAASFHLAALDAFAADPALRAAAPFQTILLLNTYHYLFAGSDISPLAYRDHRPILSLLYDLCTDRVIFSSPLDLAECPDQVQSRAAALGIANLYTRDAFLDAADEFFRVEDRGLWGKRPLLLLRKRPRPLPLHATAA